MDHEINLWLTSNRDYLSGLRLFSLYGRNSNLQRLLRIGGANPKNQSTLLYELQKIARHLAVSDKTPAMVKPLQKQDGSKKEHKVNSEFTTIENLRSEQKMIYKMLDNLHAILPYREIQERKKIAFQILDLDDHLKEIAERIAHYEKHGVIPPAVVKDEPKKVSDLTGAELIQRQMNVRTYITRYKRLVADSKSLKTLSRNRELLEKFQLELDDINKRLSK
ncbi:MAG: hypothetical protein WCI71_11910 [Bacteroidota bacterium]